jgi:hypothetical protein
MATEKILVEIEVVQNRLKETEDNIKKIGGALKELKKDEENNAAAIKATESELRVYNQRLKEEQRFIDATVKANTAKEGSLEQLKAQYAANTKALNQMTVDEIKNTQAGQDLVAQNLKINTTLKELESSYGQNARNVGNYSQAIKPLVDNLNRLEAQMAELVIQGKGTGAEFDKLAAESKAVRDSINQVNQSVKGVTEEVKPLKTQLRELNIQMQQLAEEGKADSEMFKKLQADAGRMREVMDDVSESVKRLANNPLEITLNGIMEGARGVAAGFALAQSASVLFGEENKALQETMVKLQATMLLLNSLSEIQQILRKESALATLFETRAVIADTVAKTANAAISAILNASMGASVGIMRVLGITTVATSGAFRALSLAIASTGIGLLLVAIGTLVPMLIEWTQSTDDQEDSEKKLVSAVEVGNKVMEDRLRYLDLLASEGDRVTANNIKLAKSLGATQAQINAIQKKGLEDRKKNIKDEENVIIGSISAIEGWSIKRVRAVADNADKLIEVVENKNNKYTENEVKLFTKLFNLNQEYNDITTDILVMGNESKLKAQEEYAKKVADGLKALNELERRLFSGQIDYETNQLGLKLDADLKLVGNNLALRKALYEQYTLDVAALYRKQLTLENAANAEADAQQILRDEAIIERVKKVEQAKLDAYKIYSDEVKNVDTAKTDKLNANADAITAIFVQQADLISKAFVDSISATGLDLEKFSKQALSIVIDTIGKMVEIQILGATAVAGANSFTTPQSALTGGAAGIAQSLLVAGLIRGIFTAFKAAILSTFEDGGVVPEAANGLLVGPSHAKGGIKINTPGGMIEAEGGEAIINKKSTAMFKPILSAINQAGGGVKFANGGMVGTMPQVDNGLMAFAEMFNSMPQPVVAVTDINKVSNKMKLITVKSTL